MRKDAKETGAPQGLSEWLTGSKADLFKKLDLERKAVTASVFILCIWARLEVFSHPPTAISCWSIRRGNNIRLRLLGRIRNRACPPTRCRWYSSGIRRSFG